MSLHPNISAHPDGWLVRVTRGGVLFQAFTTKLERAITLRDRFIALVGPAHQRGPSRRPLSNTGHTGISETVHWRRNRPKDCFLVSWGRAGRRRIYFGPQRPRAVALRQAVALRARMVGRRCCDVPGRVQRAERMPAIHDCAAGRGADGAARHPYPQISRSAATRGGFGRSLQPNPPTLRLDSSGRESLSQPSSLNTQPHTNATTHD